jgi:L-alanine-DL-glutamate epimerase-like enolase superfamily enzyme
MNHEALGPLTLRVEIENWPLSVPFRISGYTFEAIDVLLLSLEKDGHVGRGEAAGVYYLNDTPSTMIRQVESLRRAIESGVSNEEVQKLLPPGGARNALDCAWWDLRAKLRGEPVWQLAGLDPPRPLLTTFTCGADTPENMAACARAYTQAKAIKLKLTGDDSDADRVLAVRGSRPEVWLGVDANQGFTLGFLKKLMPVLVQSRVELIEQPFPVGQEALLDGFRSPIQVAADESVRSLADLKKFAGRFDVVNIKLDKCGGLTEGLGIAQEARRVGVGLMVGNMIGTSLAMAPAFLIGQLCKVADLDGPLFLASDRPDTVQYTDGLLTCPERVWGYPAR